MTDVAPAVHGVFIRVRTRMAWVTSGVGHVALFALLAVLSLHSGPPPRSYAISRVEFEAPRHPRHPARPPPPPPPPAPDAPPSPAVHHATPSPNRSAAPGPARAARSVSAPRIATTSTPSPSAEGMATGSNGDFHGGDVGEGGGGEPEPHRNEPAPHESATARPPPPPPPAEVAEDQLSVHPGFACNGNQINGLFPEAASDAEIEASVAVEVVIDHTGRIVRAHARSDPGFGLAAAAERAVMTACRITVIPRDGAGREVGTRVVHTIRWQLD